MMGAGLITRGLGELHKLLTRGLGLDKKKDPSAPKTRPRIKKRLIIKLTAPINKHILEEIKIYSPVKIIKSMVFVLKGSINKMKNRLIKLKITISHSKLIKIIEAI